MSSHPPVASSGYSFAGGCHGALAWRKASAQVEKGAFCPLMQVAINGERPWMDPDCPEPLRKLVTKCWHQDPHMRPSPADIMRLTEFLIQEELRKWELPQASHHGPAGQRGGARGTGGEQEQPSSPRPAAAAHVEGSMAAGAAQAVVAATSQGR